MDGSAIHGLYYLILIGRGESRYLHCCDGLSQPPRLRYNVAVTWKAESTCNRQLKNNTCRVSLTLKEVTLDMKWPS